MDTIAGRYVVERELGEGGMGRVYLCKDTQSGQRVALKRLKQDLSANPEQIERFKREAEALRELNHPNIIKVFDVLTDDAGYAFVMEYVAGGSLRDMLNDRGKLPIQEAVRIALDLSDALIRAHRLDIIHRDIKPDNVLLDSDGTPRLMDFGIAQMQRRENITEQGMMLGTVNYMPPEAIQSQPIDKRADIWSFGVLLFEMLMGQRPFDRETMGSTVLAILHDAPPDIEDQRPDISLPLVDLIYRMLEKDKLARVSSMRHVGAGLEDILQEHTVTPIAQPRHSLDDLGIPETLTIKSNLPAQTTAFVGRADELVAMGRLLDAPSNRLVTILASGGMGKTRLAIACAESHLKRYADGVFWVALADVSDVPNMLSTIAEAVGMQFKHDANAPSPHQQLLDFFEHKQLLLLLDNFEHLMAGVSLVTDILQSAPRVQILVTSRERLNLQSEQIFSLEGMDFPTWETPEDALTYSAVALFMQSARRVQADFVLQADDLMYVARICRLVYGMPLGIVLAAAWLDMLSLSEIADEVQCGLDFLETDMGDVPQRQRSIRAVFDYSWQLLADKERSVMQAVSIFRSGFSREAATTVMGADLRTLGKLVNKSLLRRDADSGRFFVHELTRQYAAEKHQQSGDDGRIAQAHSIYYIDMVHERRAALMRGVVRDVIQDVDNVILAVNNAVERVDVGALQKISPWLGNIYQAVGNDLLFRDLYERTLAVYEAQLEGAERTLWLVNTQFSLANTVSNYDQRLRLRDEAGTMFRDVWVGEPEVVAQTYEHMANWASFPSHKPELMAQITEVALAHLDAHDLPLYRVRLNIALANRAIFSGEQEHPEQLLHEAYTIAEQHVDYAGMVQLLNVQERLLERQDSRMALVDITRKRLQIIQQIGWKSSLVSVYARLGFYLYQAHETEQARYYFNLSREVALQQGNKYDLATSARSQGILAFSEGDYVASENHFQESLDLFREVGNPTLVISALQNVSVIKYFQKDLHANLALLQEALGIAQAHNLPEIVGRMSLAVGSTYLDLADIEEALTYLHDGLALILEHRSGIVHQLLAIDSYGQYLMSRGDYETATAYASLLFHHEAYPTESRKEIEEVLQQCQQNLIPEHYQVALERGKSLNVETTAKEVLQALKALL